METDAPKTMSQQERHALNSRNQEMLTKHGLTALAGSAATYALSRAMPNLLQGLTGQGAAQNPSATPNPAPGPNAPQQPPQSLQGQQNIQQNQPQQQPLVNPINPNAPQTGANVQPQQSNVQPITPNVPQSAPQAQPEVNPIQEEIGRGGWGKKIIELAKAGNGPEEISGYLHKFHGKETKELEARAKKPMKEIVTQFLSQQAKPEAEAPIQENVSTTVPTEKMPNVQEAPNAQATPEQPQVSAPVEPEGQELDEATEAPQEQTKKLEKGSTVATPQGVGEIKAIKEKSALIEINGKTVKVPVEELEREPEEVRNSTFDFDINSIPEHLRSAPLNEVYLPYDKRHVSVKYNQGLKPVKYLYFRKDGQPISNDYINKIVEGIQLPISSGKSFWGAWSANESDSRGAANYEELVKNSQEEGEKDDPSKEYWFIKEEALYEHPYMEKFGKEELRRREKEFNEKNKKPRKKRPT